jgi:hypothetical protein
MSTPAADVAQLVADRQAGKIDQATYFSRMEAAHGAGSGASATAPTSIEGAQSAMAELQKQRMAGTVGDREYRTRMDQLGAALEQAEPRPAVHVDADVQAEMDRMLQPARPEQYCLPAPGEDPAAIESDVEDREALSALGAPALWGGQIHSTVQRLVNQFSGAVPEKVQAHLEDFRSALSKEWGDETTARTAAVQEFLMKVAEKNQVIGTLLDRFPYAVADVGLQRMLWRLAQRQAVSKR